MRINQKASIYQMRLVAAALLRLCCLAAPAHRVQHHTAKPTLRARAEHSQTTYVRDVMLSERRAEAPILRRRLFARSPPPMILRDWSAIYKPACSWVTRHCHPFASRLPAREI